VVRRPACILQQRELDWAERQLRRYSPTALGRITAWNTAGTRSLQELDPIAGSPVGAPRTVAGAFRPEGDLSSCPNGDVAQKQRRKPALDPAGCLASLGAPIPA
jgi:hypothetical protein